MAKPKAKPNPEPPESGPEGLTYRQTLFVSYYLGEANGNASEAARLAKYLQPHSQGPRLLENVGIRAAIAARLEGPAMRADEVLARLSDTAAADMADFVTLHGRGHKIDVPKAIRNGKSHLIKKLTPTKFGVAIELHDSQSALEKLGRYHGLFKDKLVVTTDAEPSKTRGLLERIAAGKHEPGDGKGDP